MRTELCLLSLSLVLSFVGCTGTVGPTTSEPLAVSEGGTGATNAVDARKNLDAASLSESNTFTAPQKFVGPVIVQSNQASSLAQNGQPKLLEIRDVDDRVVASVDKLGTITGLSARVDKIQAGVVTSEKFVGSGVDLTDVPAVALSSLEYGKVSTLGCVIQSESVVDCSQCPGNRCQISFNGFPNFNWMKIGSYTITHEGILAVELDRPLICNTGNESIIRLDLIAEEGGTPGVHTPVILGSTDLRIPKWINTYDFPYQNPLKGSAFTPTEEELEVGKTYTLYVKGTILDGLADCFLARVDARVRFIPMSGTQIAIPQ